MASLRLGVHGLPAPEAGLVRALLKLLESASPGGTLWVFAADGPCDVLVADAADGSLPRAQAERRARAVLRLGGTGSATAEDALPRPLRAEQFEAWLLRTQRVLYGAVSSTRPAPPPGPVEASPAAVRFKLTRWPPPELLHGEPQRIRMASLLSRRFLSVRELSRLADVDDIRAQTFIQLLQNFQLLAIEKSEIPRPPAIATGGRDVDWNLLRSLRRRLGI